MTDNKTYLQNEHLINTFKDEANELTNTLEGLILELENNPENIELVTRIFRAMHTIKGTSAMFGFTQVSELTHHLENIYDAIRANEMNVSTVILDITFNSIDVLNHYINTEKITPEYQKKYESLLNEIILVSCDKKKEPEPQIDENKVSSIYYIFFSPESAIQNDGTNPLYLVQDLNLLGNCIIFTNILKLTTQKSPDFFGCYTTWHIILSTEKSFNEIEDNFLFISDNSKPTIEKIILTQEQVENPDFISWFQKKSESIKPIKSIISFFNNQEIKSLLLEHEQEKESVNNKSKEHTEEIIQTLSSIRVTSEKIDVMMNLVSELIIKQAELEIIAEKSNNFKLKEVSENIEAISRMLRDNSFSISLVPLKHSLIRFQRMVRDISNKFGKKVQLVIEGGETELDRTIIEGIIDPIMHMLRNSIDHGIEKPEHRIEKGKPEFGTILLKAYYSGSNVIIQIIDDGEGINLEKVRLTAIKKEFIKETDKPTEHDLIQLIMHQGFTTADSVSEVSGRGVGMDVVYQKIRDVRGELNIETQKDKGTQITIQLPLTVSIIDTLLIKTGISYYLVPISSIVQCEEIARENLDEITNNHLIINDSLVPVLRLADEFEIESDLPEFEKIIIFKYAHQKVGIIVDSIIGKSQAVVKSLGSLYRKQEIFSGASVLGNGVVALMIDIHKLIRQFSEIRKNEAKEKNKMMSL